MQFQAPAFSDQSIDQVIKLCKTMTGPILMEAPLVDNGPAGLVPFSALPFCKFDYKTNVQSIFDVNMEVPGLDLNDLYVKIRQKRYAELPAVLLPKEMPQYDVKCQLLAVPRTNGTTDVLKHFFFAPQPVEEVLKLVVGEPMRSKVITPNPTLLKKVWQWLLEQSGGLRCLWFRVGNAPEVEEEEKLLDIGFDFIEKAPRMTEFERVRWVTKQTSLSRSPIYKWSTALVEKALNAKTKEGCLAKVRTTCPIFLTHFDHYFLKHAIVPILKCFLSRGFVMLGEANQGKTPVALVLAFMFSRYYITKYNIDAEAQVRQGSDLDFFRGDPGMVHQPAILDDTNLPLQGRSPLKMN